MKMNECTSNVWHKLFSVPTKAKTKKGKIAAIRTHTSFFDDFSDADASKFIDSEFCTLCSDGIIIWCEGR